MPEYATRNDLRTWAGELSQEVRSTLIKKAQERSPAASTFLSHSSKDEKELPGVVRILSNHGANVYIDKKDDELPPHTSRETAKILRTRINSCKKFVLFATVISKDSKWMPWELGISDGYKTPVNVAIFPGTESKHDGNWSEREYLGIYDRVVWGKLEGVEKEIWMVWNQEKNTATELSRWLQQ
jgi:hypothetical protein